jgi:hypothetical protein
MGALADLSFSPPSGYTVTRRRMAGPFAVILLGVLGVFAFAWSAISPEDDVCQLECIRRRMPSRLHNKPTKYSATPIPSRPSGASALAKKPHLACLRGVFGSLLAVEDICFGAFQRDVPLDRAPPATI